MNSKQKTHTNTENGFGRKAKIVLEATYLFITIMVQEPRLGLLGCEIKLKRTTYFKTSKDKFSIF